MNEAVAQPSAPRLAGVVAVVDRVFPLVWIGLYLLLPISGWSTEMFRSWFDQRLFLAALRSVIETGRADAVANDIVGPGYVATAALLHDVLGLSPEAALVTLNRGSYALSIAAALVLVRVLVSRLVDSPAVISLAVQFGFVACVFATGTWYWSDVPWTHFFAAFLAVALYAVRFTPAGPSVVQAVAAGVLVALLATTRTFEFMAVVLAWGIVAVALALLRSRAPWSPRRVLAGAAAFAVVAIGVHVATGKSDVFVLYASNLDRQSAAVSDAEVAETPPFSFRFVPVKLVQLFVEPCYHSLCSVSDYDVGGGTSSDLWSLPLAIQLPALLLIPLCIGALGFLLARSVRRRSFGTRLRELRPLVEMTIAATGLVLGYTASTLTGPSHLRYGFARDFLLPASLIAIVAATLVAAGLWLVLVRRDAPRLSSVSAFIGLVVVGSVIAVGTTAYARAHGFPRIETAHLESVSYEAHCDGARCRVSLEASNPSGEAVAIAQSSVLTFGCGTDKARLSVYVETLDKSVVLPESCVEPRLVAAWPTVMGLPPGSFELAAVDVVNVSTAR